MGWVYRWGSCFGLLEGAGLVAVAIILFIVAPWTERKMADVGVTAQD